MCKVKETYLVNKAITRLRKGKIILKPLYKVDETCWIVITNQTVMASAAYDRSLLRDLTTTLYLITLHEYNFLSAVYKQRLVQYAEVTE